MAATVVIAKDKNKGEFIINPSIKQIENSDLELIVTFTEEGKIVMAELGAEEFSENELSKAIIAG